MRREIPPQAALPTTILPFHSSSLLSLHCALENCFALCSAFYTGESITVRRRRAKQPAEAAQLPELPFLTRVDRPPARRQTPIFHKQPTRAAGSCLHLAAGPELSRSIILLFLHPAKRKVTLVIPPFTVSARSCPAPDGRWEAAYFTLM